METAGEDVIISFHDPDYISRDYSLRVASRGGTGFSDRVKSTLAFFTRNGVEIDVTVERPSRFTPQNATTAPAGPQERSVPLVEHLDALNVLRELQEAYEALRTVVRHDAGGTGLPDPNAIQLRVMRLTERRF